MTDSTNPKGLERPLSILVDGVQGNRNMNSNSGPLANGPMIPLSMSILDSLTVHTKMRQLLIK